LRYFIFILSFVCTQLHGQKLVGKVYDNETTIAGVTVYNSNQDIVAVTNNDGDFSISARVNDTILFSSLFHKTQKVVLKPIHFNGVYVFELIKITNALDEVNVKSVTKPKTFEEDRYEQKLRKQITEDQKANDQKYAPLNNNQGVDFVYLFKKLRDLFKREKKNETTLLTSDDLMSFYEEKNFFNERLLAVNLKIPKSYHKLFLDFCTTEALNKNILSEENKMQFLEILVNKSQVFLKLINEYENTEKQKQ